VPSAPAIFTLAIPVNLALPGFREELASEFCSGSQGGYPGSETVPFWTSGYHVVDKRDRHGGYLEARRTVDWKEVCSRPVCGVGLWIVLQETGLQPVARHLEWGQHKEILLLIQHPSRDVSADHVV
jgi:hypothetical protein